MLYIPWFMSRSTEARWIALSIMAPLLLIATDKPRHCKLSAVGLLSLAFLAWALLSTVWAISFPDALERDWHLILAAGAFVWGAGMGAGALVSLAGCLGAGMAVNALLALLQLTGWGGWLMSDVGVNPDAIIISLTHDPAGLFMNGNYLAEAAVVSAAMIVAAPLTSAARIALLPGCCVCALAGGSRGAVIGLAVILGIALLRAGYRRTALAGALVGAAALAAYLGLHSEFRFSMAPRIAMWTNTLAGWTWFGHGTGSYLSGYALISNAAVPSPASVFGFIIRPQTAHNDLLTILFENGVAGVVLFVGFCGMLIRRAWHHPALYVIAVTLVLGLTNFPLYNPVPLFLFCAACGWASANRASLRLVSGSRFPTRPASYTSTPATRSRMSAISPGRSSRT